MTNGCERRLAFWMPVYLSGTSSQRKTFFCPKINPAGDRRAQLAARNGLENMV
jgi:hypothetical protein